MGDISSADLDKLRIAFSALIGVKIDWFSVPNAALLGFEPSQLAVIANTIIDAALPQIELLSTDPTNRRKLGRIGLKKSPSSIGQREAYPDYIHKSGKRVELKGLYVDNPGLLVKRPPTRREPSARLKGNITLSNVQAESDALLIAAVRLEEIAERCVPVIIDVGVFSMVECIRARDQSLASRGGIWIDEKPMVVRRDRLVKQLSGQEMHVSDYELDTNFGKLKRIPFEPLQSFMRLHKAI